jgi:stearoyl-CoA desaturase (delta-9 desaturase)
MDVNPQVSGSVVRLRLLPSSLGGIIEPSFCKDATEAKLHEIDWFRFLPFFALHLGCLGVIWVGWSPVAVGFALLLYAVRAFAITAFYHRYFSHRTFKTSRAMQLLFALIGNASMQRGPLWWAAHHRRHHAHSDEAEDVHSPWEHGFLWSHMLWFTSERNFTTSLSNVPDLASYPELRFFDRYDFLVPALYGGATYGLGECLAAFAPGLRTNGWQMLVWSFFLSTTFLFHVTSSINSLAHLFGSRRYATRDQSRNNFWLALVTFGEGWHNNHHHFPNAARQGFFWWEVDITYYVLVMFSWTGLVWDLKTVPTRARDAHGAVPSAQPGASAGGT